MAVETELRITSFIIRNIVARPLPGSPNNSPMQLSWSP
jgi:hypothetical protein